MKKKGIAVLSVLFTVAATQAAAPVGDTITLYSEYDAKYVKVDVSDNNLLNANSSSADTVTERFLVEDAGNGNILLKALCNDLYVQRAADLSRVRAIGTSATNPDNQWAWVEGSGGIINLLSAGNGEYVTPNSGGTLKANSGTINAETEFTWETVVIVEGEARIAETLYSDFGTPFYTFDAVAEFGADHTGATDTSTEIQAALDAASAEWAGVVYLPAGQYLLQSTISIPDNVTLRGDWKRPTDTDKTVAGTIMLIDHGAGTTGISGTSVPHDNAGNPVGIEGGANPAFIMGSQSGLRDLSVYYPNQSATAPVQYPFTIDAKGTFATTRNVTLVNSYDGFFTASSLPTAITIYGSPLHLGLFSNDTLATPRFESMHFKPEYWSESGLDSVSTADVVNAMRSLGGKGIVIGGGGGGGTYLGIELSGYDIGFQTFDGQSQRMLDFEVTNCRIGMDIPAVKDHGWTINKGLIDAEEVALQVYDDASNLAFNNVTFRSGGQLILHRSGTLTLQNCTFESWGSGYAIDSDQATGANTARLGVTGCDFLQTGNHILLGANMSRAAIVGNTPMGSELVVQDNSTAGYPNIVVDKDSVHAFAQMDPVEPVEDILKLQRHVPTPPVGSSHIFNVYDYGADGTGFVDDTQAIQAALDAAGALANSSAGCIVYMPAGCYRIDGRLNVPSYVELKGCHAGPVEGNVRTILGLFADKNQPDNPATIKLQAEAGIRGMCIYRPEQKWTRGGNPYDKELDPVLWQQYEDETQVYIATNLFPYPAAIEGTDYNWAYDLVLANTYDGVDFTIGDGHRAEFLYGCTLHHLVTLGGSTAAFSELNNYQCKRSAWREMQTDKLSDFPVYVATGWGTDAASVSTQTGLADIGSGIVFEGNGQFRTMGQFVNQSGGGLYIINGSPTINMYLCGGEGPGVGITVNSLDDAAMDVEVIANSYHCYTKYTVSDTSAGDRLTIMNSKRYGSGATTDTFRGDGHVVLQQLYRGVAHGCDLQLEGNATGVFEGGFMDSGANNTILAYDNSQAKMIGTITVKSDFDFQAEDEDQIYVVSVSPDVQSGISGDGNGSLFATPPAVPTGLAAIAGEGSVSLDWDDNTEADLLGYGVWRGVSGDTNLNHLHDSAHSAYVDTDVTDGTTYLYVVTALDLSGNESAPSGIVSATPIVIDREPPTPNPSSWDIVPTAISMTEIAMTATTATDPSGGVMYRFRNNTTGQLAPWQSSPTYVWSGLEAGTTYSFSVKTEDALGNTGSYSVGAAATTYPDWAVVLSDNFDAGWGSWVNGGGDVALNSDPETGSQSLNIQDNSGDASSSWLASSLDLTGKSELKIEFTYLPVSMDNSKEDFWVQYSDDGGATWITVAAYVATVDFVNNVRENPVITLDSGSYNFTSDVKLKFRCDASGNQDDIFIDDIIVSAR